MINALLIQALPGVHEPDGLVRLTNGDFSYPLFEELMFLYLTTVGRRTGLPREIEIWYTERDGRFYLIAEHREHANWVRNIRANPQVHVRIEDRHFIAGARLVDSGREPELAEAVKALSEAKYGWSDGLIVEITPIG